MKKGYLSEHFKGVAAKILSAVEVDITTSHQHEFNVTRTMLEFLGKPEEKTKLPATFLYLDDENDEPLTEEAFLTLYDSRKDHPTRSEYRFYFPSTTVMDKAVAGDLLVIAQMHNGRLLVIIGASGSSIVSQVQWLFGLDTDAGAGFLVKKGLDGERDRIEFAARMILENMGIVVDAFQEQYLDEMIDRFQRILPETKVFSDYARTTLGPLEYSASPDDVLMACMDREERLFRTFERYIVQQRLSHGFGNDVDDFIAFSLSVHNTRKSRAGYALENHLEKIFVEHGILYKRSAKTEGKSKPDFIFPGQAQYDDLSFNTEALTMLGAKRTCKDRWRQVLVEADRVPNKHLLTLETAISTNQTTEMQNQKLQLVVPSQLHQTYTIEQRSWLMDLAEFLKLLKKLQH